ncbi:endonuclease domain-containing protein [Granulicoccus sp. GXG6511]|uniref:endonuclease domain-containing protein n=1 Tax=Granulicoccus sp. GXG6511 TaxID=3381351 RepID=UPI003D7C7302
MTDFRGPFTLAQARTAGLTRGQLQSSAYQRLQHGVYAPAGPVDLATRVAAARLVLPPDAIATGQTALALRGIDLASGIPLTFVTEQRVRVRRAGLRLLVIDELPKHADRTALLADACAFVLDDEPLLAAVTLVDHVLQRRRLTRDHLLTAPLTPTARRAYSHVDPGAQSPRETLLRLALTQAGLPRPVTQARIVADGRLIGQVDLFYAEYGVVIEYEGGQHLTDPTQWSSDIDRYAELTRRGYTVIRVTAARMRRPDAVVAEVLAALRARGYRGSAPRITAAWLAAFS